MAETPTNRPTPERGNPLEAVASSAPIQAIRNILRTRTGKAVGIPLALLAALAMTYYLDREDANEIEYPHDGETFTLESLSFKDKIAQLYHGSTYDSRTGDVIDRIANHKKITQSPGWIDFTDWLTDWLKSNETIGGVHIFRSDARTIDETNRTAIEIMAKSKIPPFISMDIVGGYTRHLGLTRKDTREYGVPEEFLKIAKENGDLELPTQEDLGRAFEKIPHRNTKEKIKFRKLMEEYGAAIARLCRDIGIVINFAPVMDKVEDTQGDQFMEKNDETYGSSSHTIMALAFHYIKGFQSIDGTMIAPKHFAGTGKMPSNPHSNEDPGVSTMTGWDGTMLPFNDAIHGKLFTDPISRVYKFDHKFRYLTRRIEQLKGSKKRQRVRELERCKMQLRRLCKQYGIDTNFNKTNPVLGVMVGHAQNFTNKDTPGSLSEEIVRKRLQSALGFDGITWTDDMSMGVIDFYVENGDGKSHEGGPDERFVRALSVGITIPMILHESGSLDEIVQRVRQAIDDEQDFNHDGVADITMEDVNERVRKVLEQKVELGLLTKRTRTQAIPCPSKQGLCKKPVTVYRNNAKNYMQNTRAYRKK
ncbi:MAG: hypothetical protein O3B47_01100 [bacterium]|nr:hypothetical protein [bacterium]